MPTHDIIDNRNEKLVDHISCVFMDEERFMHRNGPLLRNIRREGVTIW